MPARTLGLLASVLALALVFDVAASARPRPGPGPGGGAPSAPTNLRITSVVERNLSLAWDASTGGGTWWYCVQRDGQGCFRVDPPNTTFTYPYLQPGTTYNFTVVALNSNGQRSAPSNVVTHTTPPDVNPPSAPTLSTTGIWPTRVALEWTRSVDAETSCCIRQTLLVDGSPVLSQFYAYFNFRVLYLEPESTHTFQVRVWDNSNNQNHSNLVTVTTPPRTDPNPPSVPQNLRLSPETTSGEIWIRWDPSTDDTDPQGLIAYEVYVAGVRVETGIGGTDTIVYCQVTGENTIAIRAMDTSGNVSAFSNEIVVSNEC